MTMMMKLMMVAVEAWKETESQRRSAYVQTV
jgi:hypothetical protein